MKITSSKKANFQEMASVGVGVAVFAVIIVIALLMASQTKTNLISNGYICENSTHVYNSTISKCCLSGATSDVNCQGANHTGFSNAWNATGTLQSATNDIPGWVPLVVLIAIGGILLMLVRRFSQ